MFDLMPFENGTNELRRAFDSFERYMNREFAPWTASFQTDIKDEGGHYVLEAELPGFNKEDISLKAEGGYLTITAEHKEEKKEEKKDAYVRRERRYGAFQRIFRIDDVREDAITAEYKNGVLRLEMPKKAQQSPSARQIEIK